MTPRYQIERLALAGHHRDDLADVRSCGRRRDAGAKVAPSARQLSLEDRRAVARASVDVLELALDRGLGGERPARSYWPALRTLTGEARAWRTRAVVRASLLKHDQQRRGSSDREPAHWSASSRRRRSRSRSRGQGPAWPRDGSGRIVPYASRGRMTRPSVRVIPLLLRPRRLLALARGRRRCGEAKVVEAAQSDPIASARRGLFYERCGGLPHARRRGRARAPRPRSTDRERKDGPNFNQRKETVEQVLYAIRNGGFSGAIMPQNIVIGEDAGRRRVPRQLLRQTPSAPKPQRSAPGSCRATPSSQRGGCEP